MRIAHCADVHIRGLSRHAEYRQVFTAFADDLRKSNVDHIYIGGDVFHTKTSGITPEFIDLLTWWIRTLAQIAPVHIILGNHDGNMLNMARQDAITPVVDALSLDNVHLYKNSGVYEFASGHYWCVFSIFDHEGWSRVKPTPGAVNIACYHGPVVGAVSETGWDVSGSLDVRFFDGYTYAMLGDIHKTQFLSEHVAYPGSMLQQNYGESLSHGYLLWDTADDTVDFRLLPNPNPYITLEWKGNVDDTLRAPELVPTSRVRIKSRSQLHQKDLQELDSLLRRQHNAIEVTFKTDETKEERAALVEATSQLREDLREPATLLGLMQAHTDPRALTREEWDEVNTLIAGYAATIVDDEGMLRNTRWSLGRFEFGNLFSYGASNVVDFSKLAGVIGVFGPNRSGKSAIVGSLLYALHNTTDRGPIKNLHIINSRCQDAAAKVEVTVGGTKYTIDRTSYKNESRRGVTTAATALEVYRHSDGEMVDVSGLDRKDTDKVIRSILGTSDDFMMTSLSAQGEGNQFINHGSTRRRQYVARFLDINVLDKVYDAANKDLTSVYAELKSFPERDWKKLIDDNRALLTSLQQRQVQTKDDLHLNNAELERIKAELKTHPGTGCVTQGQITDARNIVTSLEERQRVNASAIASAQAQMTDLRAKLATADDVLEDNPEEDILSRVNRRRELANTVDRLVRDAKSQDEEASRHQRSIKILNTVPCGDTFPKCRFIKDAHESKDKFVISQAKATELLVALKQAQDMLAELDPGDEVVLDKVRKVKVLRARYELELERCLSTADKLDTEKDKLVRDLVAAQLTLSALESAAMTSENAEVVLLRSKHDDILGQVRSLELLSVELATNVGKVQSDIERYVLERSHREEILSRLKLRDMIAKAFSKKAIPAAVVATRLPVINTEIAKILSGIVDFVIELELDEETDALEVYINYGDSRRIVELCSGMEKMIASIALRVALTNISMLPRSDIFIIDEGFGTLDDMGIEACNRLIQSLKKFFRVILVITHIDGVKDIVDDVVEVTKVEKDSRVVYDPD